MTILNKWAMTLALICAFAAPAQAQRAVDATGPGGSVVEFAQRVSIARIQNAPVRFYGRCESACTLFLSLPASRTCIVPGASFSFHRARGATDDFNQWGTDYMMSRYPEWVRAWINAHGGLTHRLLRMDYAYASQFIRTCGSTQGPQAQAQS